ncbi:hypothetical protein KCP71_02000 [Salmonella enterica subsp. enterica]|nr:hypothetical protein KCP71_02000 [Salmonella enterica subsp. enterica]
MKWAERRDHRSVVNAGARTFPAVNTPVMAPLATNLVINTRVLVTSPAKALLPGGLSRMTAGSGSVADRASPR